VSTVCHPLHLCQQYDYYLHSVNLYIHMTTL